MIEIKLFINADTTIQDLRAFMKAVVGAPDDMPISSYDLNGELEGICLMMPIDILLGMVGGDGED